LKSHGSLAPSALALALLAGAPVGAAPPARVETVAFESRLVGAKLPYDVVLPADYAAAPSKRYPVLYLLHGLTDHHSTWLERTNLVEHSAAVPLILVTPEGQEGWYTDSATVPAEKFESYLLEELIPDVARRYRTIEEGYARGVAGQSMGGYGAIKLALKHPDEFAFAASMSGALGAARYSDADFGGWEPVVRSIRRTFGPADSRTRAENDLFALLGARTEKEVASLPFLYLDCGNGDDLAAANHAFAGLLREKHVAHEYRQVPGDHNWDLWDVQVRDVLAIAARKLPRRP
jgi:putative tributyrin esterase